MTTLSEADTGQRDATDAVRERVELNRAVWRRESALLIALAVISVALENLAFAPKTIDRLQFVRALPMFAIAIGLISMVPFALRVNSRFGLPGAPLMAAKIAGERLHFRVRSLLKISAGYALLNLVVSVAVLAIVFVPMKLAHPNLKLPSSPIMKLAPGRIAIDGAVMALAAGVGEEIQCRLVLFAVFAWIAGLIMRPSSAPLSRGALWILTILQAYAFGMFHQIRLTHLVSLIGWSHTTLPLLAGGLVLPQTWGGIVLGRLYLRRGLEASILAHLMVDGTLFALIAILTLLVRLLQSAR